MNTATRANSKRSSKANFLYEKYQASTQKLDMPKMLNNSVSRKMEYPSHILPSKDESRHGKLDEVFIEDRFTRTVKQPHKWYEHRATIDSPYRDGAKNLNYSTPNQVSNVVFYDQNTNFSSNKQEMYRTSNQTYFTPPKSKQNRAISQPKLEHSTTLTSPTRYKLGNYESPTKSNYFDSPG